MNNWTAAEIAFRCDRLPVRIDRLTTNLLRLGSLNSNGTDADSALAVLRENKVFIELTAIDLDVDSAFELAQIQRQLSRWHLHSAETWASTSSRNEISTLTQKWADRLREMSGVFA
jgi:predicted nucleic acid-binding protein